MEINISADAVEMGRLAASTGGAQIRSAIENNGEAFIILATGASQFEVLRHLVQEEGIEWGKVTVFHLDEYPSMPMSHPASFRRYLKERFVDELPQHIGKFHYIDAEDDPAAECVRLAEIIGDVTIDAAFIGIGENCHIAFNDPPADFDIEDPYITVDLDDACRRQQLNEGWFDTFDEVPTQAISMSVKQILKSRCILCSVPDERKAEAVRLAAEGPVTPDAPASALQQHSDCRLFLDEAAASKLS